MVRQRGHAYVDSQSADEMRATRGTLTAAGHAGTLSRPQRRRESRPALRAMRAGEFADGTHVLRARIDMASPNINMRDPVIYRIRHARHHRTGDKWCIYPMYDYTHCISDALEHITHSICTLEFQDHRPLYDWVIERLADGGLLAAPAAAAVRVRAAQPDLRRAVQAQADAARRGGPRRRLGRSAHADARRRAPARLHAGGLPAVRRAHRRVEVRFVDRHERARGHDARRAQRDAPRGGSPCSIRSGSSSRTIPRTGDEECHAPNHPQKPELGKRRAPLTRELWIEREDFAENAAQRLFPALLPATEVRLRYGYIVRSAPGSRRTRTGNVTPCIARTIRRRASGHAGRRARQGEGQHPLALGAPRRARARCVFTIGCFGVPHPGRERDFVEDLNPGSKRVITAYVEPALKQARAEERFQFERHGYFCVDLRDSQPGTPVFNRAVTLRDSWGQGT